MAESPGEFQWRETYFVLFPSDRRPTLMQVDTALGHTDERCQLKNREANDAGYFESILVVAPDDHAALEISYETGDAVTEQSLELAKQLKDELDTDRLKILMQADARLDIMHFERVDSSPTTNGVKAMTIFLKCSIRPACCFPSRHSPS